MKSPGPAPNGPGSSTDAQKTNMRKLRDAPYFSMTGKKTRKRKSVFRELELDTDLEKAVLGPLPAESACRIAGGREDGDVAEVAERWSSLSLSCGSTSSMRGRWTDRD
ncbi:hypothetical protein VTH06DRAFT_68 [Thermothelomyces fergusii]